MTRQVWHIPSPTACAAMPTISLIVGNPVGANLTLVRPICAMSHCALTRVSPHSAPCDMAAAADDAVDLIRRHACLVHRLLAGQDGVGTERLVHRDAVPATVDRRMSDTSHRDLAAVLPYAEPVLVSPPLISLRRGHGSTYPLT